MDPALHRSGLGVAPGLLVTVLIGLGCGPADDQSRSPVTYQNANPIGTWQTPADASTESPMGIGAAGAPSASQGSPATDPVAASMGAAGSGTPASDTNVGNPGSGGADAGVVQTSLALAFDVTAVNQGGHYAPRNVGAIWIETAAGAFVKTLEVWAAKRGRYLKRFNAEAGGNRVDAVTSATLRQYSTHHVTWDLTDVAGSPAASGDYKVVIEVTDHDGSGNSAEVPFTYSAMPITLMPSDQPYFMGMQIVVQ